MKFICILGTSIFKEKHLKKNDEITIIYFSKLDLSLEYSYNVLQNELVTNLIDIQDCFDQYEEINLNLGYYTIHVKQKRIAILEYSADSQCLFDYLQNKYNYKFFFLSKINLPIIINRLFLYKIYIVICITIFIVCLSYNLYLPSLNLQRKYELLNIDPMN